MTLIRAALAIFCFIFLTVDAVPASFDLRDKVRDAKSFDEDKRIERGVHLESLYNVIFFTLERLQAKVNVSFQYSVDSGKQRLVLDTYGTGYTMVVQVSAENEIKGKMTEISIRTLYQNQQSVEEILAKAVKIRLGGNCCHVNCTEYDYACLENCIPPQQCTDDDRNLFADVIDFHITGVEIPQIVLDRLNAIGK